MQLAIELASLGKALKVLPRAGGLLDQDYKHIVLLRMGLEALAKKEQHETEKAKSKARMKK